MGGLLERETQQFAGFAIVRCNPRFRLRCYAASWPKARLRARPCCRGPRTGSRHRAPVFGERGSSSRADRDQVSGSAPRSARPPQPGSGRYSPGSSQRRAASSSPGNGGRREARSLPSGHVHGKGPLQEFRPGAISALAHPLFGLFTLRVRGRRWRPPRGGCALIRERHGLAAARTPA